MNKEDRKVEITWIRKGTVGELFLVTFFEYQADSVLGKVWTEVGHWPIHHAGVADLVTNWIIEGRRPQ